MSATSENKKTIGTVDPKVGNYEKHLFFIKKAKKLAKTK